MEVTEPGIYEMSAEAYHADPCPEPSLSASVAHILDTQSALHAWEAHPRLNPAWQAGEVTPEQEAGVALHALIIEGRDIIHDVPFPDWRKKEAQEGRDYARRRGEIPMLEHKAAEVRRCAEVVRARLAAHEARDVFGGEGRAEAVMVWRDETPWGPIWMRSRVDWLGAFIDDLKTTGGSAHPDAWTKKLVADGYAMQRATYMRGARILGLRPRDFRFVVVEQKPPHDLSVITLGGDLQAIGDAALERGQEAWAWSMREGKWPGYPRQIVRANARAWELAQHEERQITRPKFNSGTVARVVQSGVPFA